jgi:ubiquinone/menaquinone biosynthesis C-methylase UbiE
VPNQDPAATEARPEGPTPGHFDETFAKIAAGKRLNELFDEVLGPFPMHVEPFSLVTREGLDHMFWALQLGAGDHLADLCCGRGGIGLWFAQRAGARLTGVDFSPGAVAQAERRAELFPGVEASFIVADAAETSLEGQSVDAVLCVDALQMLPEREQVLREIGRVLRPGGRAVLATWEMDGESMIGRSPIRDLAALTKDGGLDLLLREEHPEWLERQRELFERAVAEDGDDAEPGVRMLAEEGRVVLPEMHRARRVLVVATTG